MERDLDDEFDDALDSLIEKGMIIVHYEEGKEPTYEIAPAGIVALGGKLS